MARCAYCKTNDCLLYTAIALLGMLSGRKRDVNSNYAAEILQRYYCSK